MAFSPNVLLGHTRNVRFRLHQKQMGNFGACRGDKSLVSVYAYLVRLILNPQRLNHSELFIVIQKNPPTYLRRYR